MPSELPTTDLLPPSRIDRQFAKSLSAGPSLDCLPTTDKLPRPQSFREQSVARCRPELHRLESIYAYGALDPEFSKRKRLNSCRSNAVIVQHEVTHELRVTSRHCNLRWCPLCQTSRRWIIANSVTGWLKSTKHPKFITVTLKSSSLPLEEQVESLYSSFRALRRRSWLARALTGGVWFFQFTYNHKTDQFHPHVHCLVDGDFIPHSKLKNSWREITHDSYIVDIRKVDDHEKAAKYVARYATAPANLLKVTVPRAAQALIALSGRRIVGAFGSARGIHLAPRKPDEPSKWRRVADYWFAKLTAQWDPLFELLFVYLEQPSDFTPPLFDLNPPRPPHPTELDVEPITWKQAMFDFTDCYHCGGSL